ncbi:MAG: ECF transporter S component [Oscillospiraceae bacterium]|nr:ECF transporter S component [Oscillospiraceae bacterium]
MQHSDKTKKLVLMALFSAIAYMIVALVRIPVVLFLSYEPKDVVITIGGFLLGPLSGFIISLVVSLIEMVTISQTGIIGCVMNLISTCSFACVASLIYKKQRTLKGAVIGLISGSVSMIIVMLLWNWLITPLYMGVTREAVEGMLLPVFLPFNALKAGLNSALFLGLYKPLTLALRKAQLLPPSRDSGHSAKPGIYLFALFLLAACILFLLVLQGKI